MDLPEQEDRVGVLEPGQVGAVVVADARVDVHGLPYFVCGAEDGEGRGEAWEGEGEVVGGGVEVEGVV